MIMKKIYRIKKSNDIEIILKNRKTTGNKYYTIYIKENSEADHFRLAVSVSKKIGNAVVRNRNKRLIRQAFTELESQILPYDIFVIAKSGVIELSFSEIKSQILMLLNKINLINKEIQ